MEGNFNSEEAKQYLLSMENQKKEEVELARKNVLQTAISALKKEFKDTDIEVYLVGSIIRPHSFSSRSDVDIVLKNYHGDRFELWSKLESAIGREVEIILFESCHFKEFIEKEGLKVI